MAQKREISAHFSSGKRYFENKLGNEFFFTDSTGPYEYLLGALAGCYISTLSSYYTQPDWTGLDVNVVGIKRDEIPTVLEETTLNIVAKGVGNKKEFNANAEKASKECSIFQTIAKVSEMRINIEYED